MTLPLMPKATAVWLVENTSLTFEQIAAFCGLHPLEIQGIADDEVAIGIVGLDPMTNGQLTKDEIVACEADPKRRLTLAESRVPIPQARGKGPRYTPVAKRQDRPNAISWLLRFHPELTNSQVVKLVGTTKPTINAIRDRTHWNITNIKQQDPVSLGMCSQIELDEAVGRAAARLRAAEARERKAARRAEKAKLAEAEEGASAASTEMPVDEPEPDPLDVPAEAAADERTGESVNAPAEERGEDAEPASVVSAEPAPEEPAAASWGVAPVEPAPAPEPVADKAGEEAPKAPEPPPT